MINYDFFAGHEIIIMIKYLKYLKTPLLIVQRQLLIWVLVFLEMILFMRAIRGAISIDENSKKKILADTKKLLVEMIQKNNIDQEEIVSIEFTATRDLDEVYPAVSARKIGLMNIPLLCFQEMHVKKSLEKCIRIMIYINRDCSLDDINHVYLKKAEQLRPDLT